MEGTVSMEEMTSLADLLDLQEVDLQIDRLLHERQSLPELDEYRNAHEHGETLQQDLADAQAALRETSLALDKTEGEMDITAERLDAEQNRLYAGGLSARDAEYLRREVEMLTRKRSEAEDSVLELMERREQQEGFVAELTQRTDEAATAKAGIESTIKEAWKGIDAQLGTKEARKAGIVPLIEEDLLDLYEQLRDSKEGVAIGALIDNMCGGCHLKLTAAEILEAKRTDPTRCIHCRRILVI
jgi:predicted  nucleic acid-binding Zn-ribbon protein